MTNTDYECLLIQIEKIENEAQEYFKDIIIQLAALKNDIKKVYRSEQNVV